MVAEERQPKYAHTCTNTHTTPHKNIKTHLAKRSKSIKSMTQQADDEAKKSPNHFTPDNLCIEEYRDG